MLFFIVDRSFQVWKGPTEWVPFALRLWKSLKNVILSKIIALGFVFKIPYCYLFFYIHTQRKLFQFENKSTGKLLEPVIMRHCALQFYSINFHIFFSEV